MKTIIRMFVFSAASLYMTTLLIHGFDVATTPKQFLFLSSILAVFHFIIAPVTKLILLPLNILTLGLVSIVVYILLFNFVVNRLGLVTFANWTYKGWDFWKLHIPEIKFTYWYTVTAAALSYSLIINLMRKLL